MRTRIKFCGCTSVHDVELAVEVGVDAVGVIFAPSSPRYVPLQRALDMGRAVPAFVSLVGVFVEPSADHVRAALGAGFVPQFSGNEAAEQCERIGGERYVKVFHLAERGALVDEAAFVRSATAYAHATWMFDTAADGKHGGTGRRFDWDAVRGLARERRIIVSGGLSPDSVGECVRHVRPYGVDVRSGIETNGVKDPDKMRAFVRAVKEADEQA